MHALEIAESTAQAEDSRIAQRTRAELQVENMENHRVQNHSWVGHANPAKLIGPHGSREIAEG